jgi:hypothetical protein
VESDSVRPHVGLLCVRATARARTRGRPRWIDLWLPYTDILPVLPIGAWPALVVWDRTIEDEAARVVALGAHLHVYTDLRLIRRLFDFNLVKPQLSRPYAYLRVSARALADLGQQTDAEWKAFWADRAHPDRRWKRIPALVNEVLGRAPHEKMGHAAARVPWLIQSRGLHLCVQFSTDEDLRADALHDAIADCVTWQYRNWLDRPRGADLLQLEPAVDPRSMAQPAIFETVQAHVFVTHRRTYVRTYEVETKRLLVLLRHPVQANMTYTVVLWGLPEFVAGIHNYIVSFVTRVHGAGRVVQLPRR